MSQAENQDNSTPAGTDPPSPGQRQPSQAQMGQSLVKQAENLAEPLEGDYDTQLEVIGDIHETDIGEYKSLLSEKYGEDGPDAIAFTGDAVSNEDIRRSPQELNPEGYTEDLEETYEILDEIGDEFDLDVYKVRGNHEAVKGAHSGKGCPGNEQSVEKIESYAKENIEGFEDFDGNYDDFAVSQFDNLEDISYDSVELEGGLTLVGGGSHFSPEEGADSEKGLEGFLEEYDDDDWEEEEWNNLVGSWFGIGDIINGAHNWYRSTVKGEKKEQYIPDDIKKEEHKEYEEKFNKLDSLLSEAEGDTAVLTHGAPYGEDEESIDFMGEEKGNQGSVIWKELLQKHDVDSYFFGHQHGGGEDEMYDTRLINIGEGEYFEAGLVGGEIDDKTRVKRQEIDNWSDVNTVKNEGPEPLYEELEEEIAGLSEQAGEIRQAIEEGGIPEQRATSIQTQLGQQRKQFGKKKEMVDAISQTLDHDTRDLEEDADLDLGISDSVEQAQTETSQESGQTQEAGQRMTREEAIERFKQQAMENGYDEQEAERIAHQQVQQQLNQQAQTAQAEA